MRIKNNTYYVRYWKIRGEATEIMKEIKQKVK